MQRYFGRYNARNGLFDDVMELDKLGYVIPCVVIYCIKLTSRTEFRY